MFKVYSMCAPHKWGIPDSKDNYAHVILGPIHTDPNMYMANIDTLHHMWCLGWVGEEQVCKNSIHRTCKPNFK